MTVETDATTSGHCVNGWAPVGNILIVLTRTGALNLRAARRELPNGSRVHHSSNMIGSPRLGESVRGTSERGIGELLTVVDRAGRLCAVAHVARPGFPNTTTLSGPLSHFEVVSFRFSLDLELGIGHDNHDYADGHPDAFPSRGIREPDQTTNEDKERKSLEG